MINNIHIMRRSCNSLTSLTSLTSQTSINSRTKIFNNRDFQRYVANIEDDIIKLSNDYYYYNEKYDRKIDNLINRYDGKTNKLYIDLRNRENDFIRLNKKVMFLYQYFKTHDDNSVKNITEICFSINDTDEYTYRYMMAILNIYTLFVVGMLVGCVLT